MSDIIWKGSPNHYVGRNGYGVTHITLHIMVGYLAGTDARSPASQAVPRPTTHRRDRRDPPIRVGTRRQLFRRELRIEQFDISIEHEGGMANGAVCTQECIDASARLCADIARRYGWTKLWHDAERQCLAAPGDPRHRPPLMPRPRAQRPAIQADHRQSKSDTRGRNHVKRRR